MNAVYSIIYNPLSGNKTAKTETYKLDEVLKNNTLNYIEMSPDFDYNAFFANLKPEERVVLVGGDGTVNKVANVLKDEALKNDIYYFPTGCGNDFMRDITGSTDKQLVKINDYLKNLPVVSVKGTYARFINGIGYGIDGYCCEEGDRQRLKVTKNSKPINYTAIAVKGVLLHYRRTTATVTVDGVTHVYKNVWLASTMKGRYYGGGMMACPNQDRNAEDKKVSVLIFRGKCKIRDLIIFSSIFSGEHIAHKRNCIVLTGNNIQISFDKPRSLQIDGETVLDVSSYSVRTN